MRDTPAPYESYDDPERLLRRFVIRRTGEMGRMADWLGRLLDRPRRAMDAAAARLDAARRAEVLAATARALAWANALRRWMITINRVQKEEFLQPAFAPAPAGSLVAGRRDAPGSDAPERDPPLRAPAADFAPMAVAEMWEALKQPFLSVSEMERMVASVQARVVTLTCEIDADRRRVRAADAACAAVRTPEEDAAALGVEELPFGESLTRICDDLIVAATALGEADVVAAVRAVAADLECRWLAIGAAQAARTQAAQAQRVAARAERAAIAEPVAAVVGRQGIAAPRPAALPAGLLPAGLLPADFAVAVPPRHTRPSHGSLRAELFGSVSVRPAILESV